MENGSPFRLLIGELGDTGALLADLPDDVRNERAERVAAFYKRHEH